MIKTINKIATFFVACMVMVSLIQLPQTAQQVRAASVERPDVKITQFTISHQEGTSDDTFKYWENLKFDLDWDASMYQNNLKAGDYFTVNLPSTLRFGLNDTATQFDIVDKKTGVVTGRAEVTAFFSGGGTLKVTFTNAVENVYEVKGTISTFGRFVYDKIKIGEVNTFQADINGKPGTASVTITQPTISPDEVLTKWSSLTANPKEVDWTVRINYGKAQPYTNVVFTDALTAQNGSLSGIQYIPHSFVLSRVEVAPSGEVIREYERTNISDKVKLNATKTAFTYDLGTVPQDAVYYVTYKTTYVSGIILDNKVKMASTEYTNTVTSRYQDFSGQGLSESISASQLKLIKVEKNNDANKLAGTTFKVTSAAGESWDLTTDNNGEATLYNLLPGKYTIVETAATKGYILNATPIVVELISGVNKNVVITNEKEAGTIEVTKTDKATNALLAGAEFDVKDATEKVVDHIVTNQNGVATTKALPYGTYSVVETKAPLGYVLNTTAQKATISQNSKAVKMAITNVKEAPKTGNITIYKVDAATKTALAGAEFDVKNAQGAVVGHVITDAKGNATLSNLPLGAYSVVETKAPVGYVLNQTATAVKLDANTTLATVTIENQKQAEKTGNIEITKVDGCSKRALAGAEFDILDANETVVDHVITNDKGIATSKNLPLGIYHVVETKAPAGYILNATPTYVRMTEGCPKIKVTKTNMPQPKVKNGSIVISKYDSETKTRLSGMTFSIRHVQSGMTKTVKMREYNTIELTDLPLGTYEIKEQKAPDGYDLDAKVYKVELTEKEATKSVDIFNVRQRCVPRPCREERKKKVISINEVK